VTRNRFRSDSTTAAPSRSASRAANVASASRCGSAELNFKPASALASTCGRHSRSTRSCPRTGARSANEPGRRRRPPGPLIDGNGSEDGTPRHDLTRTRARRNWIDACARLCEAHEMPDDLTARLTRKRFPRSSSYDAQWLIDNVMGPQPLWLMEWLYSKIDLPSGARVLDLGCGTALTSIFLAREYGLQVVAADLWVDPSQNWTRIVDAGCAGSVLPIRAEAHDLAFAHGYFDAIVSVDAYHYFGTDERYLAYVARFLRPGGYLAIAVPALVAELDDDRIPDHLEPYWAPDFWTFHSPGWWRQLWSRSDQVDVDVADLLEDGWQDWALWNEACAEASRNGAVIEGAGREAQMVRLDAGRNLGFARVVARRR
jgi:cyclopropane fatty-acyl-phospholipid synthase-like methyltransferase